MLFTIKVTTGVNATPVIMPEKFTWKMGNVLYHRVEVESVPVTKHNAAAIPAVFDIELGTTLKVREFQ